MKLSTLILTVSGLLWILAISVGMFAFMKYEYTPGAANRSEKLWPGGSHIALSAKKATLIMFVHPQCPCSKASINELARLTASCKVKPEIYTVLLSPTIVKADWDRNALRSSLLKIEGLKVLEDIDGTEAKLFGALTSGHTMIYNSNGQLLYSGGITGSRGQVGDNQGLSLAKLALDDPTVPSRQGLVFGCSLTKVNSPEETAWVK